MTMTTRARWLLLAALLFAALIGTLLTLGIAPAIHHTGALPLPHYWG